MNDGSIGFGIGLDINAGGLATHLVTITCDDGREYKFKATCMKDEGDEDDLPTLYKVCNGEKDYDTYVEIDEENDTLNICIEDEFIFADIIDSDIDGADMTFDCEEDGVGIHIQADFILGDNEEDISDVIHTSSFDLNEENEEDDDIEGFEDIYPNRKKDFTVCGIMVNGELDDFVKQLRQKGFREEYDDRFAGYTTLKGKYYGYKSTISINLEKNSTQVRGIDIVIDECNRNINDALKLFNEFNDIFTKEYGPHNGGSEIPDNISSKTILKRMVEDFDSFYHDFDFYKGRHLKSGVQIWLMTDADGNPNVSIDFHKYEDSVNNDTDIDDNIYDDDINYQMDEEHLQFRGIPIDGNVDVFVKQLGLLGFKKQEVHSQFNIVRLTGAYAGEPDCSLSVFYSPKTKIVNNVIVNFPYFKNKQVLHDEYNRIIDVFERKYGAPNEIGGTFDDIKGNFWHEMRYDDVTIESNYLFENPDGIISQISIYISVDDNDNEGNVCVMFRDGINSQAMMMEDINNSTKQRKNRDISIDDI